MRRRPRIGITTYHRDGVERLSFSLPSAYVDAVREAEGLPFLLPPGDPRPHELLEHVDAVIFGGGGDLDPDLFGGRRHPTQYSVSRERDEFELDLMRAALERDLPVLAICRGMQVLNVARGGTLHVHLPDRVGEEVRHRESQDRHTEHAVRLEASARLAEVVQARDLVVSSWHHQGVATVGEGLRAVGWAPDGTVETLELTGNPRLLAVQWHPEINPDVHQRRLFRAFVAQAAAGPQNR